MCSSHIPKVSKVGNTRGSQPALNPDDLAQSAQLSFPLDYSLSYAVKPGAFADDFQFAVFVSKQSWKFHPRRIRHMLISHNSDERKALKAESWIIMLVCLNVLSLRFV